jgi:hypothetical protein
MCGEKVKKISDAFAKGARKVMNCRKRTEKLKRKRRQIVRMNQNDYPVDFDGLAKNGDDMEGEDWVDSDYPAIFREYLYRSDYWNLDRSQDMPDPEALFNEIARGEFYVKLPIRRAAQDTGSPAAGKPPNEHPRPYPMKRAGYGNPRREEAFCSWPERGKLEDPYFDWASFQVPGHGLWPEEKGFAYANSEVPDFDLWPRQKNLYG